MRMLVRRASATSNIIDVPIAELVEYDDVLSETLSILQSMFKGGSSLFRDQVCTLSQWFGQWTHCEQTVALYTLLRQLDSKQARFVENLLQEQASTDPSVDILENQANDLEFVLSLSTTTKSETLITQLLSHFPLLHPGNEKVKDEYLKIIPKVLSNSVENSSKVEDCRKLLTYTLIHPAVSNEERSQFTKWLSQLERQYSLKITQTQLGHSNVKNLSHFAEHIDSTLGQNATMTNNNVHKDSVGPAIHKKLSRTCSDANQKRIGDVGPSTGHGTGYSRSQNTSAVSDWVKTQGSMKGDVSGSVAGTVSPCHSDHAPLSPRSSLSSTDSDQDAVVFYQENSGMKEFPAWLKSLRLHKYSQLFANVSYEEMLSVDERWLADREVTKGARNKLAQSIAKLRERAKDLRNMEKLVVEQGANLKQVLSDLKAIAGSPMKPYQPNENAMASGDVPDNDLPGLVNRLMGKLCTQLLVNRVEDDCYPMYIQLIDKCLHHEAFTVKQRKLLQEWRSQVAQRNNGRMLTGRLDQRSTGHRQTSRTNSWNTRRGSKGNVICAQRAMQGQGHWGGYEKKSLTVTYSGPDHVNANHNVHSKPAITKPAIHRTHSAPIRAHQPVMRKTIVTEPEINERLDSLARSMTEAALSSQDSMDNGDGSSKTQ